ncbi:MAG TPA: hypothetical protein VFK61_06105 [Candidatus Limnocylindria bacterium]|nr:hypothetical protein [Candidatus Limnocylindria bacterium]
MTVGDRLLAAVAWLPHQLRRLAGGRGMAVILIAIGLAVLSAIPTLVIATTPYPWTVTLEELEQGRFEGMPTWVRVNGELRPIEDGPPTRMNLYDPAAEERFLTVEFEGPMQPGATEVTGRIYTDVRPEFGGIAGLHADVGPVPEEDQPWPLILAPLLVALLLLVGVRLGYPVLRPDRAERSAPGGSGMPDGGVPVRWYGHLGGREVAADDAAAAQVMLASTGELWQLQFRDAARATEAGVRRGSQALRSVRACTPSGCVPALQLLASNAQVVLLFDDREARDRLFGTF